MNRKVGILYVFFEMIEPSVSIGFSACCNLQSLSGHTSAVESVSFDSSEVLVAAGAASGTIKLWDLEEAKSMHLISYLCCTFPDELILPLDICSFPLVYFEQK